jgi:hypothetical protein
MKEQETSKIAKSVTGLSELKRVKYSCTFNLLHSNPMPEEQIM